MVIGLSECQNESVDVLEREAAAVAVVADPRRRRTFKGRPEFAYMTLGVDEAESVLIAVREENGSALKCLDMQRRGEGKTTINLQATIEALHTIAA